MLASTQLLCAQSKRDTPLKEINVKASKPLSNDSKINYFSPGQQVTRLDSATLAAYQFQNLSDLLAQKTPVFIKSYGVNGLATLNIRGSSAAQNQVLWEGVPIQNAALGIADLSTLPVIMMNNVSLVYGGSAALWGSGNVGGALVLENERASFDTNSLHFSLASAAGSYGQTMYSFKTSITSGKWFFSAAYFGQNALNNFWYTGLTGLRHQLTNSKLTGNSGIIQLARQLDDKSSINLSAWYQEYDRQIPPALFESASYKYQQDNSLRLLGQWHKGFNHLHSIYFKSSIIKDDIHYSDAYVQMITQNTCYQYFQEAGWNHKMEKYGMFEFFMPVQISWMNAQNPTVKGNVEQTKTALAGSYAINFYRHKLELAANCRQEWLNNTPNFTSGANASYQFPWWLKLRANIQQTYRAPSLNELYYYPGGNTSLKPEQGWSTDAGYSLNFFLGKLEFKQNTALFYRDIHDWILWLGGAVWTPQNIAEVVSRGAETENKIVYSSGRGKITIGLNTSYVLATTKNSYIPNDGSIGRQIPYSPRYNGQLNLSFETNYFTFCYNETYTGYRFITMDDAQYLPPYQTGNFRISRDFIYVKHGYQRCSFQLSAQVNNIWDQQYQVVAYRPMPGRNFLVGLRLNLHYFTNKI